MKGEVEELKEMDRSGEITLLHWRTGAENDGGNLPSDDADARHMYHGFVTTPAVAVDGYPENFSDIQSRDQAERGFHRLDYPTNWFIRG